MGTTLRSITTQEIDHQTSSAYKWSPAYLEKDCPYDECPEGKKVVSYFVSFLHQNIKVSIDSQTLQPVKEDKFGCEYECFSEIQRIVDEKSLDRKHKIDLISVPSRSRIRRFLRHLYDISGATTELIVYSMILLQRLLEVTGWSLRAASWRSLVMITLRICQKVEDSPSLSAGLLHRAYPLFNPRDFVNLENVFLRLIDFRLTVSLKQFSRQFEMITRQN